MSVREWALYLLRPPVTLAACLAVATVTGGRAQTPESRLALVIGNARYPGHEIPGALVDARLMARALTDAGFQVTHAENVARREVQQLIRSFGDSLRQERGVGFFYYAGHAIQLRGSNCLVPAGADLRSETELADDCVDLQLVLAKMESAANPVNLVVLEASRQVPGDAGMAPASAGLVAMNAPARTLVAYSAMPGQLTREPPASAANYTRSLARLIGESALAVEDLLKKVRAEVRQVTKGLQTPWENTALETSFQFHRRQPASAAEVALWTTVRDSRSVRDLKTYLDEFPEGAYASAARARLIELQPDAPLADPRNKPVKMDVEVSAAAGPVSPHPVVIGQLREHDRVAGARSIHVVRELERRGEIRRFDSGEQVDPDGRFVAIRAGGRTYRLTMGRLWALAPSEGESGSAELDLDDSASHTLWADWAVARMPDGKLAVEMHFRQGVRASATPAATGVWLARYEAGSPIPVRATWSLRRMGVAAAGGSMEDRVSELVDPATSATAPVLVSRDDLTGVEQRIAVHARRSADGSLSFGSGDTLDAAGRVLSLRLGSMRASVTDGQLWRFPLTAGSSGQASIDVHDGAGPGTLRWRVGQPGVDDTLQIEAQVDLPGVTHVAQARRIGTWTARFIRDIPVALQSRLSLRPSVTAGSLLGGSMVPERTSTLLDIEAARWLLAEIEALR